MNNGTACTNTKSIAEVMEDLKNELMDFAITRLKMLRAEISEKVQSFKMAAPVLTLGLALLLTAWFVLTGFLVCIIAAAFTPHPWAYTVSFLIVGVLYAIVGGAAAFLAWRQLKDKGIAPQRTIEVLKQDRIWLQNESRTQL